MPLLQVTSFSIPQSWVNSCLSNKIILCSSCLSNSALRHVNAATTDTASSPLSTSATTSGSSLASQLLCRGQASHFWQRQAECEKKREVYYPNCYVQSQMKYFSQVEIAAHLLVWNCRPWISSSSLQSWESGYQVICNILNIDLETCSCSENWCTQGVTRGAPVERQRFHIEFSTISLAHDLKERKGRADLEWAF